MESMWNVGRKGELNFFMWKRITSSKSNYVARVFILLLVFK